MMVYPPYMLAWQMAAIGFDLWLLSFGIRT